MRATVDTNVARRTWQVRRYAERRQAYWDHLGGKCVECGATERLEIDHIDPATKVFTLTNRWQRPWGEVIEELDKCQLLCKPHHKAKTDAAQSVEHGGGKTGKRNCRCELCGPLKLVHNRDLKRRKRELASSPV